MKNNKILKILILIFCILMIGLISFVVYNKLSKETDIQKNDNNVIDNENDKKILQEIEGKYLKILYDIDSLEKISNQKLLYYIVFNSELYEKQNFTKNELEEVINNTIYRNIDINHEDIWSYGEKNSDVAPAYSYNKETQTYSNNPVGIGHCEVRPNISEMVDYIEENNKYIIKYKYAFYYGCEGSAGEKIYGSYDDALKQNSNYVFEVDLNSLVTDGDPHEQIKKIEEENYKNYSDKLDTYNYVFEKNNDQFLLIDFYIN